MKNVDGHRQITIPTKAHDEYEADSIMIFMRTEDENYFWIDYYKDRFHPMPPKTLSPMPSSWEPV